MWQCIATRQETTLKRIHTVWKSWERLSSLLSNSVEKFELLSSSAVEISFCQLLFLGLTGRLPTYFPFLSRSTAIIFSGSKAYKTVALALSRAFVLHHTRHIKRGIRRERHDKLFVGSIWGDIPD